MVGFARSRFFRIGLVTGVVMTGLVGLTSFSASSESPAPPTVPYGKVTIDLFDRSGRVTFDPAAAGLPTLTQALGVSTPCSTLIASSILDPAGQTIPGDFLHFSATAAGTNPNVQLPGSTIGVTDGANCGEPSGLFGPGETLTLTLGDYFPDEDADGPTVDTARLNIGKSRSADGKLRVAYDGGAFGSEISIANSGQFVDVGGPAVADFTSITLRSTTTQSSRGLSLKTSTVFDLVAPLGYDQAVDCGDVYAEDGSLDRSVTFQRLANGDKYGTVDCEEVGVTIMFGERTVTWDNGMLGITTGSDQDVRGFVTVEWDGLAQNELDRLETFINYDGIDTGPFFPVTWCQSWNGLANATGVAERPEGDVPLRFKEGVETEGLVDEDGVVTPEALDDEGNFDVGPVPWCMVSNEEHLGDREVVQTQIYYGAGDPTPYR